MKDEHYIEVDDGYFHLRCEADEHAECRMDFECGCERHFGYEVREETPYHLAYNYEKDEDEWHKMDKESSAEAQEVAQRLEYLSDNAEIHFTLPRNTYNELTQMAESCGFESVDDMTASFYQSQLATYREGLTRE